MVADLVARERGKDLALTAIAERPGLLADEIEAAGESVAGKRLGPPALSLVRGWRLVVLAVEEEKEIDWQGKPPNGGVPPAG